MIANQNCIDFGTKAYRLGHFSSPSYKGGYAGWPAGWLGGRLAGWLAGHQNAPKTRTLSTKVRQKRVPLGRKSMSEMPTWHPVVNKYVQKCTCPPEGDLSNKHYSRCSISTRDWAAAWLGAKVFGRLAGWLGGYQNASKMQPLRSKFGTKCDPFVRNKCHNACLLALHQ